MSVFSLANERRRMRPAVLSMVFAAVLGHGGVTIAVSTADGIAGEPRWVEISLTADREITMLQCDLVVDRQLLEDDAPTAGTAAASHRVESFVLVDGERRLVATSYVNAALGSGTIARLPLQALSGATAGTVPIALANVILTDASAAAVVPDTVTAGSFEVLADSDADGIADSYELAIIDASPDDAIATLADVPPDDDYDGDLWSNREEYRRRHSAVDSADFPEWQLTVTAVRDGQPTALTLGYRHQATDDIDAGLDAASATAAFAWIVGPAPEQVKLQTDFRAPAAALQWAICTAGGGSPVTLSWPGADLPADHHISVTAAGASPTTQRLLDADEQIALSPGACTLVTLAKTAVQYELVAGWNLFSLPLLPANTAAGELFGSVSAAPIWFFDGARYVTTARVTPGVGYWWYTTTALPAVVPGTPQTSSLATLDDGWQLIGVTRAQALPEVRAAWTWDAAAARYRGVSPGDLLEPGRAYWLLP